jgi:hypothetical protein
MGGEPSSTISRDGKQIAEGTGQLWKLNVMWLRLPREPSAAAGTARESAPWPIRIRSGESKKLILRGTAVAMVLSFSLDLMTAARLA